MEEEGEAADAADPDDAVDSDGGSDMSTICLLASQAVAVDV